LMKIERARRGVGLFFFRALRMRLIEARTLRWRHAQGAEAWVPRDDDPVGGRSGGLQHPLDSELLRRRLRVAARAVADNGVEALGSGWHWFAERPHRISRFPGASGRKAFLRSTDRGRHANAATATRALDSLGKPTSLCALRAAARTTVPSLEVCRLLF
jgi:hypothetical protein